MAGSLGPGARVGTAAADGTPGVAPTPRVAALPSHESRLTTGGEGAAGGAGRHRRRPRPPRPPGGRDPRGLVPGRGRRARREPRRPDLARGRRDGRHPAARALVAHRAVAGGLAARHRGGPPRGRCAAARGAGHGRRLRAGVVGGPTAAASRGRWGPGAARRRGRLAHGAGHRGGGGHGGRRLRRRQRARRPGRPRPHRRRRPRHPRRRADGPAAAVPAHPDVPRAGLGPGAGRPVGARPDHHRGGLPQLRRPAAASSSSCRCSPGSASAAPCARPRCC